MLSRFPVFFVSKSISQFSLRSKITLIWTPLVVAHRRLPSFPTKARLNRSLRWFETTSNPDPPPFVSHDLISWRTEALSEAPCLNEVNEVKAGGKGGGSGFLA
jgi:hypothetical protein